jgi:hypothetical protein
MNASPDAILAAASPPGLIARAGLYLSWVLSGAAFLSIGWVAMGPDDPYGPVSLFARADGPSMLVQAAALAAVVAALGTILGGKQLADAGSLAAALGLAMVSLRGETTEYFLLVHADRGGSQQALAIKFLFEALAWTAVMIISLLTSGVVSHWLFGGGKPIGEPPSSHSDDSQLVAAADELFQLRSRSGARSSDGVGALACGLRHTLVTIGLGLIFLVVLSTGLSWREIQAGQVCFLVAASVMIAEYFAVRIVPVRSAFWAILGVIGLAFIGYSWSALRPVMASLPPNIPTSHFLRILPIQFIAVGMASAIASFWHFHASADHPHDERSRA